MTGMRSNQNMIFQKNAGSFKRTVAKIIPGNIKSQFSPKRNGSRSSEVGGSDGCDDGDDEVPDYQQEQRRRPQAETQSVRKSRGTAVEDGDDIVPEASSVSSSRWVSSSPGDLPVHTRMPAHMYTHDNDKDNDKDGEKYRRPEKCEEEKIRRQPTDIEDKRAGRIEAQKEESQQGIIFLPSRKD